LATRRYRIHFVATFDQVVDAETIWEAQKIAWELEKMPSIALASSEGIACRYNHITHETTNPAGEAEDVA